MTNSREIKELHPAVRRGCEEFIRRMKVAGYSAVGISSTYRSSDYQDYLYAQGRTRPGSIVTNARGGQSMHNFRLAFDFFQNIPSKEWSDANFFATGGRIWREMGGMWGGDWKDFIDKSHCEYTGGLTLKNLQDGKKLPDNAVMPWESSTPPPPPEKSFAPSDKNLAAMVALGVMNSPEYWRKVTNVQYLDNLLTNAASKNLLDSQMDNGVDGVEAALSILQDSEIVSSPDYWRNLVNSGDVPHLGNLLVNIARRSRRK